MPNLNDSLGPIVCGAFVCTMFFGAITLQLGHYLRNYYREDRVYVRATVSNQSTLTGFFHLNFNSFLQVLFLYVVHIAFTICICHTAYIMAVTDFGQLFSLLFTPISLNIAQVIGQVQSPIALQSYIDMPSVASQTMLFSNRSVMDVDRNQSRFPTCLGLSPMPADEITLFFFPQDGSTQGHAIRMSKKDSFSGPFRKVETLIGKEEGALGFTYSKKWLQQHDTPEKLRIASGSSIHYTETVKVTIVTPNRTSQSYFVTKNDPMPFSVLFERYARDTELDLAHIKFTLHNRWLAAEQPIVTTLGHLDNPHIYAQILQSKSKPIGSTRATAPMPPKPVVVVQKRSVAGRPTVLASASASSPAPLRRPGLTDLLSEDTTASVKLPLPRTQLPTPAASVSPPVQETAVRPFSDIGLDEIDLPPPPATFLADLRAEVLADDASFLREVIVAAFKTRSSAPSSLQRDDVALLRGFAGRITSWRDALKQADTTYSLESREGMAAPELTFLARQQLAVTAAESFCTDWKNELRRDWAEHLAEAEDVRELISKQSPTTKRRKGQPHRSVRPPPAFREEMLQLGTRRLLREARMACILSLIIDEWTAQVNLAPLANSLTDLHVQQVCRMQIRLPLLSGTEDFVFADLLDGQIETYMGSTDMGADRPSNLSRRSGRLQTKPALNYRLGLRPKYFLTRPASSSSIRHPQRPQLPTPAPSSSSSPAPSLSSGTLTASNTRRNTIQRIWTQRAAAAGAAPIEIINDIDSEEVPPGVGALFTYSEREYVTELGVSFPTKLVGCQCKESCSHPDHAMCHKSPEGLAYNAQGLYTFQTDGVIVECNKNCSCGPNCINRVAQRPRQIPIQIIKTRERGWGVRCPVPLPKGKVLGLYTGLLIKRVEADKLPGTRGAYLFDLDMNEDLYNDKEEIDFESLYTVDALPAGNWTRFLNHSCDPNLINKSVVLDSMPADNVAHIAFITCKDIPAYTELTFDYNPHHGIKFQQLSLEAQIKHLRKCRDLETRCFCGSKNCRGYYSWAD
ncbi:SET-domain-containing protein [Mycena chlorophos]|uniref:SET-domain-containing protein n=1 Tax=Mycena chlorophos TaxID=658473 RepID=A0A8H6SRZ1_MYCCL|nr:SET-domain-containing protein [Mycena chlorophos]